MAFNFSVLHWFFVNSYGHSKSLRKCTISVYHSDNKNLSSIWIGVDWIEDEGSRGFFFAEVWEGSYGFFSAKFIEGSCGFFFAEIWEGSCGFFSTEVWEGSCGFFSAKVSNI